MTMTTSFQRGVCLLLVVSASVITADSKTSSPSYYGDYDYDLVYDDADEKTGNLPIAPHYPSHGRPPSGNPYDEGHELEPYRRPPPPPSYHSQPSFRTSKPKYKPEAAPLYRETYEPPVYKPKPTYEEPEVPAYKPRPRPTYEEPAYKPRPAYEEPAYKPEPTYKPKSPYQPPAHKPKPAYHEPAYKPKQPYREPAHKPKATYEEPNQDGGHHKSYKPKNTIPGEAGVDYPIYNTIPVTKFTCDTVPYRPGMYANPEASCQVYHVCDDDRYGSRGAEFLCTNGTIFNQETFSCDWWYNVDCSKATEYYDLNTDPDHNPYYQKLKETKEETHGAYKPDPYKAPKPQLPPSYKPQPSYHKPSPSYRTPAPKPRPSYHSPSPKPTYRETPKPVYRTPSPKPYRQPTPRPAYHSPTPKPSYRQTPQPSYRPTPKPSYHITTVKPSYRSPAPRPSYHPPAPTYLRQEPTYRRPEPSYRTPEPSYRTPAPSYRTPEPSYRTPEPSYRRPVRRPSYHEPEPSYHVGEEEYDFGPDFEWGARF